jgi:hypothetical protein
MAGLPPDWLTTYQSERKLVVSRRPGVVSCMSIQGKGPTEKSKFIITTRSRNYFTTGGQSWCWAHFWTCDQILLLVGTLLSESCSLVSLDRPVWREGGSAVCSVITQWSESLRTRNHILLSHLRFRKPGGPGSGIYITQEENLSQTGCVVA